MAAKRTSPPFGRLILPSFGAANASGPFVVTIEGPNGAGKSTLIRGLRLPHCMGTDDVWLSKPLKARMIREADWFASAMFFLSGYVEQMRIVASRQEPLILMDRSLWSTLAVHAAEDPARLGLLLGMLRPVADLVRVPHLTLVLEASFATCQSRISKKTGTARALDELTANERFHARERRFYRWLGGRRRDVRFLDVDQATPQAVALQARELICHYAPC
jgi:thymidylate kinase